jgi:glycosyltransferase involved in cell wall biosynthesis
MKETLSVVLIVKNEEDKLGKCLESVRWADEIVIVDDMSTDGTLGIASSYGARTIRNPSGGNFDRQRNLGIAASTSDWILQMDADEIVPPELKDEIISILKKNSSCAAFKLRRKNYFLGHLMRYGGWSNEYSVKLTRKGKAGYIGKSVHETLKVEGETGVLVFAIEHYPFKNISEFIERQNFYTSVECRVMLEEKARIPDRDIMYNIKVKPVKLFWKAYVKKQGFREGFYGFVFSLLFAWVHYLRWVKYWESLNSAPRAT